ncbi:MAG: sulfite exporter TauE/SafE family protein [Anaerolineales bacterium]|nr:sulfite exporter TauE/SafE family protein [Anaerolineales bacterium]
MVGFEIVPLFMAGILTGFGHCVGMCGPIVAAFTLNQQQRGIPTPPALSIYHMGRIMGLMMLGAIFGLLGLLAANMMENVQDVQAGMTVTGGVLVLLFGLGLIGVLPTQRWIEQRGPGRLVARYIGNTLRGRRTYDTAMRLGIANGLLPCGPSYTVALVGFTVADPLIGMFVMFIFGMGTIPALLIVGYSAGLLPIVFRRWAYRIAAVMVIVVGIQLILRGLAFYEVIDHLHLMVSDDRHLMVW